MKGTLRRILSKFGGLGHPRAVKQGGRASEPRERQHMTTSKSHAAKKTHKKVRPGKARPDRSERERSIKSAKAARSARETKAPEKKHEKLGKSHHPAQASQA